MLNGIIVINKPAGMTSADVVYQLRKILQIKKIGHAGTLDPDVSGVLPIAIGQATKLIDLLHENFKEYQGSGRIGVQTDTGDLSGKVIAQKPLAQAFSRNEIQAKMDHLTGEILQVPPMYSAVKINGKKLYEYARAGESVDVPPRKITVADFKITNEPVFDSKDFVEDFDFTATVSKGTYIRTLIEQLADQFDYPGVMTSLVRTKSGGYTLNQAVSLEFVQENLDDPAAFLQPIESVFTDYPSINLTKNQFQKVQNGVKLTFDATSEKLALIFEGKIKAIYQKDQDQLYKPDLMLLKNE